MLGVHDGDAYNPYVDPTLPLAFSVHSSPGVYAALLGSGVSRAAGIPTGWEVTLDLISKLAAMSGEAQEADADPAAWFRGTYGEEPDYSRVLNHLTATPADRQRLLQGYFEPTEEEREEGVKTPTDAHRAIAHLAAKGYMRVIITTNFDKLMERALEAEGVNPVVVSTPDAAEGAPPVQHARCTIVKVHGDYLDARIKNTPAELASYDPRMDALLDKTFRRLRPCPAQGVQAL
jgi:NAD-dependent SIR2 family protein deacetylase